MSPPMDSGPRYPPPLYEDLFGPLQNSSTSHEVLDAHVAAQGSSSSNAAVVTPVDPFQLPLDITEKIFFESCQPIAGDESWYRPFYPLYFGRVNRQWRQFAWSTSSLWTTVVVRLEFNTSDQAAADRQKELLREWIERAQGRLLDIFFDPGGGLTVRRPTFRGAPVRFPHDFLDIILQYHLQWKKVKFVNIPYMHPQISTPGQSVFYPAVSFPKLHSIIAHRDPRVSDHRTAIMDFRLAPLLRSLTFINIPSSTDKHINHEKVQITDLSLDSIRIQKQDLNAILKDYPRLQEIHLSKLPSPEPGRHWHAHAHLKTITIDSSPWRFTVQLFETLRMSLPGLKNLRLTILDSDHQLDHIPLLLPAIQNLDCTLTTLSLTYPLAREDVLIDFLFASELSSLRELHLGDSNPPLSGATSGISRAFFEALQLYTGAEAFLPSLEVLTYRGNLNVGAIDFMEPLILRSRVRSENSETRSASRPIEPQMALLRRVKIEANQFGFTIAEYQDAQYKREVEKMTEQGILWLRDIHGRPWV